MGISAINALNEGTDISISATIIWRPMDCAHWCAPNHTFGETTEVGGIEARYDYDYNYKNEFQIWKETRNLSGIIFP